MIHFPLNRENNNLFPGSGRWLSILAATVLLVACGPHPSDHDEEEDDHHGHEEITLSPEQALDFGIETEEVAPGPFREVIKTSGSIEAAGGSVYTIAARKSGIVTLLPSITEGSVVSTGQPIATIASEGLQGGDINRVAQANLQAARSEYERLKPLYEDGLVTASTYREAERAYNEAKALAANEHSGPQSTLTANNQGTVARLFVRSGEFIDVGAPVAEIVQNSLQVLRADLPARFSSHVSHLEGANFIAEGGGLIKLSEHDGKKISGDLPSGIISGYIPVYFSFSGNSLTSPGGFAEVFLLCGERQGVITVPRQALVEIQGNNYVYVKEDEEGYEKRLVATGSSDGERVEITSGLEPGEEVVTKGASIVRMAEISSVAPPAHTHNH
ncbi:MAG: efflux RND transporter periplasmic adaptor subunit [Muribaculaceae bacterium]|nr:efflux RND transporter periplasmic adaptor subunit [Muribaculaceae bacterium]